MITKIALEDWKSFRRTKLFLDPLTVLIGTNASGKSNAIDALDFLARIAESKDLRACLEATENGDSFRGGKDWVALRGEDTFRIVVDVDGESSVLYRYTIAVRPSPSPLLVEESLVKVNLSKKGKEQSSLKLFWTDPCGKEAPAITARLYNTKRGTPREMQRGIPILTQLNISSSGIKSLGILNGLKAVWRALANIFILNPIPSHMRDYSQKADKLSRDGSNLAGVLAALPYREKTEVESKILSYVKDLPEKDILSLEAELFGAFNSDAMLLCKEGWKMGDELSLVDARAMSDGTLRFIAISAALLTLPVNTQLVIEEVDNGLHPSRAKLLLRMLREIGDKRRIDVIASTHNPALLDALGPEMVPFVVVAHRENEDGLSRLTLLEDVSDLPKLMAGGTLGKLASRGDLESSLKKGVKNAD